MRRIGAAFVVVGLSAHAHAQTLPPKSVWTKFQTLAPHAGVARAACTLDANAIIDGASRPIALDAIEDAQQLCAGRDVPGAIRGRVRMTADPNRGPTEVVVELDVAPTTTPAAYAALQSVLVRMSADLERRSNASMPPPPPPPIVIARPIPMGPMHEVAVTNVPFIAAGAATFGATYLISLFVGAAIVGATGDPGTGRGWPFVPFIGLVAFSTTYKEAANCDCSAGRAFSIIGSVVIDAAQIAGVVLTIVGITKPRMKMVPDTVSLHVGPAGAMLEGRF